MRTGWKNRLVTGTLLVAALAVYVDVPQLRVIANLGDTLNAVRVLDAVSHVQFAELAAQTPELSEELTEGQESLDLITSSPVLMAVLPPQFMLPNLVEAAEPLRFELGGEFDPQPLTGLGASFLSLDLPPPKFETLFQPPRLDCPIGSSLTSSARAPPLALR